MKSSTAHMDHYVGGIGPRRIRRQHIVAIPSIDDTVYNVKPYPHTKPQSHYEQQLVSDGIDVNGMGTAAIRGFYDARKIAGRVVSGEPPEEIRNALNDPRRSDDVYCAALAIGISHYMTASPQASGQE